MDNIVKKPMSGFSYGQGISAVELNSTADILHRRDESNRLAVYDG